MFSFSRYVGWHEWKTIVKKPTPVCCSLSCACGEATRKNVRGGRCLGYITNISSFIQNYAHLHFDNNREASNFYSMYKVYHGMICRSLPVVSVGPALLHKGQQVTYQVSILTLLFLYFIDVKQNMQSLLYKIEDRLEDAGDDQARFAMMVRIEAAIDYDEEVSLKDLQPPSKLKPKGRPRRTGGLLTANEQLDKQMPLMPSCG